MESPYAGRAIIEDNFNGITISIPSKKNWIIIIFLSFWLCIWLFVVLLVPLTLTSTNSKAPVQFILLLLCGWTVGAFFVFRTFLWNIIGKEEISVSPGIITINRKGVIFYKAKSYDLNEARNFRVQEDPVTPVMSLGMWQYRMLRMGNSGTIRFDYGMQTVKFAGNLDEAEASFILDKLKSKKLIN